jgi:hypothetical protein
MSTDVSDTKSHHNEVSSGGFLAFAKKPSKVLAGITAATLTVSGSFLLAAVPAQAAPGYSQSASQYLSGSLLGTSLGDIANIDGVQAQVPANGTEPDVEANNLNLQVLGDTVVIQAPNGVQIPIDIANAGVLGQYAQAAPDGSSTAATGAVGGDGTVGVAPDAANPPGPLTLDLTDTLGADVTDNIANLRVTAGASTASATQAATGNPSGDYQIAGTNIAFTSPVLANLTGDITDATVPLQNTVNGVTGADGSLLTNLTGLVDATGTVTESNASLNVDLAGTVNTVLDQNQILGADGPVTVNLATGEVTVDVAALLAANGQDLNDLPANTELLSADVLNLVTDEINGLVNGLLDDVNVAVDAALNAATLNVDLVVANPLVPGTNLLDVSLTGTLEEIANGTTTATVAAGPAALVNTTIQGLVAPLQNLNVPDETLDPVRALYPTIADVLTSVASLQANVQENADGTFTETALRLSLLGQLDGNGNALQLNLAQAAVGPNSPTVEATPTVSGFTPTAGPETGGTVVTITGTGFTGTDDVLFGGDSAADFTVDSDTQITATTPAGTGDVPVTVVNNEAAGDGVSDDLFSYIPENGTDAITDFTPVFGPEAGGTDVTINGSGFTGATGVLFGDAPGTNFTVVSDNEITVTSPAGTGAVPLVVTAPDAADNIVSDGDFTYVPADVTTIVTFSPNNGPEAGGTVVTITGSGFTGTTGVTFGDTPAESFTVNSDNEITATTPAGTGSVPVALTGAPTGDAVSSDDFTYVPAASTVVTGFTPISGPEAGGTEVTINGAGFTGATGVNFGDTPATGVTVLSDNVITAISPAGTGAVPITVTGTDSGDATSNGNFTYIPAGTAAIVTFSPTAGPEAGGTVVTITGGGFTGADDVRFGDVSATDFTVVSDTTIIATSPAGTGPVPITVVGTNNGDATSEDDFTYVAEAGDPTIAGFTPTSGPATGGTRVVITGTGLAGTDDVLFGGVSAQSVIVNSDTQLTVITPPGVGVVPVTVVNNGVGRVNATDEFTYIPADAPTISDIAPNKGSEAGGTVVTIIGSGFAGTDEVLFGDVPATEFTVVSDTQITATAPAGTGVVDVTVRGTDLGDVTADDGYTYVPSNQGGNGAGETPVNGGTNPNNGSGNGTGGNGTDGGLLGNNGNQIPTALTGGGDNSGMNNARDGRTSGNDRLAYTGADFAGEALLAGLLVAAGGIVLIGRRRFAVKK